jgi:predicted metalloprotease with PDZ domain
MNNYFRRGLTGFFVLLLSTAALAQSDVYRYSLDLTKVKDDQLQVQLETPPIEQNKITFYMPKIIPGTYRESDYGMFVSGLKAYNKKGKELPVKKLSDNSWEISKANKLARLSYWVEDIFDTEKENQVYMMSATNIEEGKNFVIHTPGFFGYFDGMKEQPFEVSITKPESFYGSTGLIPVDTDEKQDIFRTRDYDMLMDSPIMYNRPDTTFIDVANAKVLVSVYSPNKQVTSEYLAGQFEKLLRATAEYLGGKLPVEKYAFIMYFAEPGSANPRQGALEHNVSSFYYISERSQQLIAPMLVDIAAHEFFHIVTPLTIHSEEIADFDFNEAVLSKHLWLYEGVTEYASDHVQVRYNHITQSQFLDKMLEKIQNSRSRYNDTLPFTELSQKAAHEHAGEYGNVYEKGSLIAAMLDIRLLELSGGKMDLQKLLSRLSERYGKNKPFQDDKLFGVIEEMTYPEIGTFLSRYVGGSEPLPLQEYFAKVGVDFQQEAGKQIASLGNVNFGFNQEQMRIEIASVSGINPIGFEKGDLLLSIQGQDLTPATAQAVVSNFTANTKAGDQVKVVVGRKNEAGEYTEQVLAAPALLASVPGPMKLTFAENPTYEQLKLRNQWLQANPVTAKPEDVKSIDAIVTALYEVISGPAGERDWNRFASLFKPNAHMAAITPNKSGERVYVSMTPGEYKEKNEPYFSKNGFWEEELGRQETRFGEVVSVMSAYQYRLEPNGEPAQRGVNSLQLVYDQGRWWIANIIWNTETKENKIPQSLLP